jgi:hypothetical protein
LLITSKEVERYTYEYLHYISFIDRIGKEFIIFCNFSIEERESLRSLYQHYTAIKQIATPICSRITFR